MRGSEVRVEGGGGLPTCTTSYCAVCVCVRWGGGGGGGGGVPVPIFISFKGYMIACTCP